MSKNSKTNILREILKNRKTYLIVLVGLLIIALFDFIRMLLFDDQKSLESFIVSHIMSTIFTVLLIIQLMWLEKTAQAPILVKQKQLQKFNPTNAIVSFICSLIPLPLMIYCLIVSGGSENKNGPGAVWWLFVGYAVSVGIPVFLLWLFCGIIGLKTSKRKLALVSLIIKPIGYLIICVLSATLNH